MPESKPASMPLGPVMLDVAGKQLSAVEREVLAHPLAGGAILFARNYESPAQLKALTAEIRAIRTPQLLIAVDQEGGRVQRFIDGFTRLPPMRKLGVLFDRAPSAAMNLAQALGVVLGSELRTHGVDFSFTPVLDIDFGSSGVIGDRAFHQHGEAIVQLAGALIDGLAELGVGAVGKHFPGHGFVRADSHVALPVDERSLDEIRAIDLLPYRELIPRGLAAVMPAHVIYANIDPHPAGFSRFWLQKILRGEYGFQGLIFSDDLSMRGASVAGGVVERAQAALAAGCDMALVCNAPGAAYEVLEGLKPMELNIARAENMRRHGGATLALETDSRYQRAHLAYAKACDNALLA